MKKSAVATIESCACALPRKVVTNHDLVESGMDTSDEWIMQRSGIKQRYIASGEDETTAALAIRAGRAALREANMDSSELDLIIVATCTPTLIFPSTATQVQGALGVKQGSAFDIAAACSGFIYGLNVMDNFFRADQADNALLIGVDSVARVLDWEDRATAVLFGDGAGAVAIKRANGSDAGADHHAHRSNLPRGILASRIFSDGEYVDLLNAPGGAGMDGRMKGVIHMNGRAVFRHAVDKISNAIFTLMDDMSITAEAIDWFVPHQANKRILDAVAKQIGLDKKKVIVTVDAHANTSAASVPLALDQAVADGRIKRGDLIMMEAMGAGFTWGASLVRW